MMTLCDGGGDTALGEMTGLMSSYATSEREIGESGIDLREEMPVVGAGDGDGDGSEK